MVAMQGSDKSAQALPMQVGQTTELLTTLHQDIGSAFFGEQSSVLAQSKDSSQSASTATVEAKPAPGDAGVCKDGAALGLTGSALVSYDEAVQTFTQQHKVSQELCKTSAAAVSQQSEALR